ncbi:MULTISPECIES: hypothetical protein [Microbacterium]|uniref:hypothetical protein n=1 Tax=Microbacterium TaxID=33882 RepID=UPI000D64E6FD|nr:MULTISPECIES: hypothetical protein [Microbacterium]
MASIDGSWAIEVATLAGSRRYDLILATAGTSLTGTAISATGPVPLRNGTATGDRAAFTLDLMAPLPMSLRFELHVVGDRLAGTAQSGPYPASTVVGTRTA